MNSIYKILVYCTIIVFVGVYQSMALETKKSENYLLELILKKYKHDKNIDTLVIGPDTYFYVPEKKTADNKEIPEDFIRTKFDNINFQTYSSMVRLFQKNKKSKKISYHFSENSGIIIDDKSDYEKYFKLSGQSGLKIKKPEPPYIIKISVPIYDKANDAIFVYINYFYSTYHGEGVIYVYKYNKGELIELDKVSLWALMF